MSKHTPGPWEWTRDEWHGGYSGLAGPNGAEVLYPDHCNDGDDGAAWFEEFASDADRRLIAAAPELLALLESLLELESDCPWWLQELCDEGNRILEEIKK
jgi:hypothetical protein